MPDDNAFHILLANARPRQMTQREAAAAIGVRRPTLTLWEGGRHMPPADKFAALLALYETQDHVRLALLNAAARSTPTSTEPA